MNDCPMLRNAKKEATRQMLQFVVGAVVMLCRRLIPILTHSLITTIDVVTISVHWDAF